MTRRGPQGRGEPELSPFVDLIPAYIAPQPENIRAKARETIITMLGESESQDIMEVLGLTES